NTREFHTAQPLLRRLRPDAQARAGDHAERPFAADQKLGQIGTGAGTVERAQDGAGAVDRFQREDHVLDLSVLARELPGAARGEPSRDITQRSAGSHETATFNARRSRASALPRAVEPGSGAFMRAPRPPGRAFRG